MKIGDICAREVVCAAADIPVVAAAKLMRQYHVGDVVVTQNHGGKRIPSGIITDRDIVLAVVAPELAPDTITVGDIMRTDLMTAGEVEDVFDAIQRMRDKGVRRMPVVDADGGLAGIVSLDAIVEILAEQMTELARLIAREQLREQRSRK
jgi:CBS domain-containing protein